MQTEQYSDNNGLKWISENVTRSFVVVVKIQNDTAVLKRIFLRIKNSCINSILEI